MAAESFHRVVVVAIVDYRPVVTAENDKRVLGDALAVERCEDLDAALIGIFRETAPMLLEVRVK